MATKELGPKPDERSHALIEDFFESFFRRFDLKTELKRTVLDGFDTVEDYEKYGDMFIPVDRRSP